MALCIDSEVARCALCSKHCPTFLRQKHALHCAGTPGHLADMMHQQHAMLASPMTPVMCQQQHQHQQQPQYASPYHGSVIHHLSPGGWELEGQLGTPQHYSIATPQSHARLSAHAASPGSNQPYTCYVCNATATSRKNYIAHLQVSCLHHSPLKAVLLQSCHSSCILPAMHACMLSRVLSCMLSIQFDSG